MMLGALITIASTAALAVWFSPEVEAEATGKPQPKLADEGLDLAGAPA
jgi:hypothetical protein